MKITRLGKNKDDVHENVSLIDIEIDGQSYRLTERFGKLNIQSSTNSIAVFPCVANVIEVQAVKP